MKNVENFGLALLILFSGCAAPWRTNLMPELRNNEIIKGVSTPPEYVIQKGDELIVKLRTLSGSESGPVAAAFADNGSMQAVKQQSDGLRGLASYPVDEEGVITLPYLGKAEVAGLTITDAKRFLEKRFYEVVKTCSVEVNLKNNSFTAMGEWGSGTIRLPKDQTNIYEALALTGKLSDFGDRARVKIVRQTPSGVQVHSFNLRSKQIFSSEFFWVQPNDVIYIQPIDGKFLGVHSSIYSVIGLITIVASVATLVLRLTN